MDDTQDAPVEPRGEKIASFMGRITLYDDPSNVSRANRPIVADDMQVKEAEAKVKEAFAGLGYTVTVDLTRTDNER